MSYMNSIIGIIAMSIILTGCTDSVSKKNTDHQRIIVSNDTVQVVDTVHADVPKEPELLLPVLKKNELTEKDLYMDYDGGDQLSEFFVIELIDKNTFLKNKSLAVNYLVPDSMSINKHDGIIKLPAANGEVCFVDNLTGEENQKEYTYIGQIDKLDVFLMSGIYWEDWNYFFVDRVTGKTVQVFPSQPYVSADLKYIVSIDVDIFEGSTYLDLYEVIGQKDIEPLVGMYVKKWIPINSFENMYWANDNYLYIAVVHNADFWVADGNFSGLDQYIRLRPIV